MDKSDIADAIIYVGQALRQKKSDEHRFDEENQQRLSGVEVGFPLGTILYSFCYEDGMREVVVVGKYRICVDGCLCSFISKDYVLAETPEGAVAAAIESWRQSGELDMKVDVDHFTNEVQNHVDRAKWAKLALDSIRELSDN